MGKKWTSVELDALKLVSEQGLKGTDAYHKWGEITGYSKTYNAWEVKQRRVATDNILNDIEPMIDYWTLPEDNAPSFNSQEYNLRIGFFDLETTDLKGNFGRILCGSMANQAGVVTTLRGDDPKYRGSKVRDDSRLVAALRDMVESYDWITTWNGKAFDMKFLDTRLALAGERPVRKDLLHTDLYYTCKQAFRLHSYRLDAAAKTFNLPVQKTVLDFDVLQDAAMGDEAAMNNIVEHCEADVLVLRGIFGVLRPYIKIVHR
jgi:uncharacterized protein YprB with RNaseH-like and TPR domain